MSIDINDPAVKEAIAAAVKDATDGLKRKNDELLAEVKEARKGKAIDPAELEKRDALIEELQGQVTAAQKAAKLAQGEAEKAAKALQGESAYVQSLLVDNGLTAALTAAGVTTAAHLKAVKAMLAGQVQIVAEGEQRLAKVGDKPLAEFVSTWAKGDEGKYFVAAPNNTGGGSQGGNASGGARGAAPKRSDFPDDIQYSKAAAQHHAQQAGT
jgi:hypothetical protein